MYLGAALVQVTCSTSTRRRVYTDEVVLCRGVCAMVVRCVFVWTFLWC
jgi:hypothetical protein